MQCKQHESICQMHERKHESDSQKQNPKLPPNKALLQHMHHLLHTDDERSSHDKRGKATKGSPIPRVQPGHRHVGPSTAKKQPNRRSTPHFCSVSPLCSWVKRFVRLQSNCRRRQTHCISNAG